MNQVERILELRRRREQPCHIAAQLKLDVGVVRAVLEQHGEKLRPASSNKPPSEAEIAEIVALRNQGFTIAEVSRRTGRSTHTVSRYGDPTYRAKTRKPRMRRACRCCGRKFNSERAEGAWLRLCETCRKQGE